MPAGASLPAGAAPAETFYALYTSTQGTIQPDGSVKPTYVDVPVWVVDYANVPISSLGPPGSPQQTFLETVYYIFLDSTGVLINEVYG